MKDDVMIAKNDKIEEEVEDEMVTTRAMNNIREKTRKIMNKTLYEICNKAI